MSQHVPYCLCHQVCEYEDCSKSLKLGDFGLATVVEGPLYTVCGTPTYVAPEIISENGYAFLTFSKMEISIMKDYFVDFGGLTHKG